MVSSTFSSAVLSVLLLTLLSHPISAAPAPKPKSAAAAKSDSSSAPPGWTCPPSYYDANDGCDCGCGIVDPDCEKDDQSLYCQSDIDPETARCDLDANKCVPQDWTCSPFYYDSNDGCDCECGVVDPDCEKDDQALYCQSDIDTNIAMCDLTSNRCLPRDWTCASEWFNTKDGCDCGCGAFDLDCNDDDQFLYCHKTGLPPFAASCNHFTHECEPIFYDNGNAPRAAGRTPPPKGGRSKNRAPENVFVPSVSAPPSKPRPTSARVPKKALSSSN